MIGRSNWWKLVILNVIIPTGMVYVSYACDSDEHRETLRSFVGTLRSKHSIDCCDYEHKEQEAKDQFVCNWVAENIQTARKIVVICSPEYYRITELYTNRDPHLDNDDVTVGESMRRTRAEWRHIRSRIYSEAPNNCCVPVLFEKLHHNVRLPFDLRGADPLCWPREEERLVTRLYSCNYDDMT